MRRIELLWVCEGGMRRIVPLWVWWEGGMRRIGPSGYGGREACCA